MDFFNLDTFDSLPTLLRADSYQLDNSLQFNCLDFLTNEISIDSAPVDTQMNKGQNYASPAEYLNVICSRCNCKETIMQSDLMLSSLNTNISRQSSNGSKSGFRLHKDASEKDVREFVSLFNCDHERAKPTIEKIENCDKQSNASETDTGSISPQTSQWSLAELAINMIENHKLTPIKFGELSEFDKVYLANIVFIRNKAKVDPSLSNEEFIEAINLNLGELKEKRNDDRLRFIYKRAIKYLLAKTSDYMANKLHKMEDFKEPFIEYYFQGHPDKQKITAEVMDTSFASRKKLLKFFKLSVTFKQDFLDFANNHMQKMYLKYTKETYESMQKHLAIRLSKKDCAKTDVDTLMKTFKRLPWRCADVQSTIEHISFIRHF